ncbi:hypothetical protein GCM10027048_40710 [Hymenobacter coalescens]
MPVFSAPFRRAGAVAALGLALLTGAPGLAQPQPRPSAASVTGRARPAAAPAAGVRDFPAATLRRLRADEDLQYREAPPADNPLRRWWQDLMRRFFSTVFSPDSVVYWRLVFYALALGALVLVVMHLLGLKPAEWLRSRGRRVAVPFAVEADDVHEATLPKRLREAEETGQWRLATRLGYLLVLKALTDRGLIEWLPEKTNHHYDAELRLSAPRQASAFGALTWQFEYVWYGEFPLTAAQYEQVRADRQAFLSDLHANRAA